jgi:hypothetical protein
LLAEAIPLEQALLASWLAQHGRWLSVLVLSLLGFAGHAVFEHRQLQAREGGHPMFEPRVLRHAGITRGLILVNTDHGFALGHEPGQRDAKQGLVIARAHGDAHDRALWKSLGEPATYYYRYGAAQSNNEAQVTVAAFAPRANLRFEAEAEWPVLGLRDAWAIPGFPPCACVSQQRALIVHPSGPAPSVAIALYVAETGRYHVRIGWVTIDHTAVQLRAVLGEHGWILRTSAERFQCQSESGPALTLSAGEHVLRVESGPAPVAIDWMQLEPAD